MAPYLENDAPSTGSWSQRQVIAPGNTIQLFVDQETAALTWKELVHSECLMGSGDLSNKLRIATTLMENFESDDETPTFLGLIVSHGRVYRVGDAASGHSGAEGQRARVTVGCWLDAKLKQGCDIPDESAGQAQEFYHLQTSLTAEDLLREIQSEQDQSEYTLASIRNYPRLTPASHRFIIPSSETGWETRIELNDENATLIGPDDKRYPAELSLRLVMGVERR